MKNRDPPPSAFKIPKFKLGHFCFPIGTLSQIFSILYFDASPKLRIFLCAYVSQGSTLSLSDLLTDSLTQYMYCQAQFQLASSAELRFAKYLVIITPLPHPKDKRDFN